METSTEPGPMIFKTMQTPTPLLKYGRSGAPHFRYFYLTHDRTKLIWHSDKKKSVPTEVSLFDMIKLVTGQKSEIFKKNQSSNIHPQHLSFSVFYHIDKNMRDVKTLDIVCKDQNEFNTWVTGLVWLIANKEVVRAAASSYTAQDTRHSESMKLVNVAALRDQMHSHVDLYTWGAGSWGQLGHTDKPEEIGDIDQPKKIRHLVDQDVDVKFVAMGSAHSIAIAKNGLTYAWGHSGSGRLGIVPKKVGANPAQLDHVPLPMVIETLRGYAIQTVACGAQHTLFVTDNGLLFATGCNFFGQLGTGDREDRVTPVQVHVNVKRVIMAAAGDQNSAIVADGECYSGEVYSNLGHGDNIDILKPKRIDSLASHYIVRTIACGGHHTAVIADSIGSSLDRAVGDDDVAGSRFSMRANSVDMDQGGGTVVLTWGWGACGQLGRGDCQDSNRPEVVHFQQAKFPRKISCGMGHTACILDQPYEGQLFVWGSHIGVAEDASEAVNYVTPRAVAVPSKKDGEHDPVSDVACGEIHTAFLTDSGFIRILGRLPNSMMSRDIDYCDKGAKTIASGGRQLGLLVGRKWIRDMDTDSCMNCSVLFSYVNRRHHCRSCGGIYCDNCTRKRAPVLKFGYNEKVRVCDNCYTQITTGTI